MPSGSSSAPSALATALVSLTAPSSAERQRGSERTKPIGRSLALVVSASALRRASFDHRTWRSLSPVRTSIPAPAISVASAVTSAASVARSTRIEGLVWTISPGAGRSDSTLITPATTASNADRSRSMCSIPLSSGTANRGAVWIRVSAASSPVALVATSR